MTATYPTLNGQLAESTETWLDDLKIDRAVDGTAKARAFFTGKKRAFMIKHELSYTDRDTLEAFYDANRTTPFYFTWDGDAVQRVCLFDGAPRLVFKNAKFYADVAIVEQ